MSTLLLNYIWNVFPTGIHHSIVIMYYKYTKTSEVNLYAFIYKLFHEDHSSIIGTNTVGYSQASTCCGQSYFGKGEGWGGGWGGGG